MLYLKRLMMLVGAVVVAAAFIHATSGPSENVKTDPEDPEVNYRVVALPIPESLDFAGEDVPLADPDVRERLDRELLVNTYWQSNALLMIKRSAKYFPVIEPILKKYGVPDDFKYLAVIESGLTNAVSPAGASGFWQLMKATAKELNLEVNENVDERYHLEKATEAACQYLLKAKERHGSWTMAAAAYNAGSYGMEKQLARQKVENYYNVLLGEETGRYVFRILAMKEIIENPKGYGFLLEPKDYYKPIPVTKVAVDTAVTDFADFAKRYNLNYKVLKIHNPWLREAHLNNTSGKRYEIALPEPDAYALGN